MASGGPSAAPETTKPARSLSGFMSPRTETKTAVPLCKENPLSLPVSEARVELARTGTGGASTRSSQTRPVR